MRGINKRELLEGNILKGILKLAFPLMLLNLINTMYNVVDTFWVGKIGELQVGAVSLVSPIMDCGNAFATGLCAAGMALIAIYLGANKKEKANEIATHLILMGGVIGIIIGVVCIIGAKPILMWLDTPSDIFNNSYLYLMGISLDFLFLFIISIFQAIRQSNGDSKTGVKLNAIAAIINMVLDPILIFNCHMGVFGAALATTLSKVFVIPIVFYILFTDFEMTSISFKKYPIKLKTMMEILKVAIPASAGSFLSSFGFVMMNKNIVAYGSIAMSAYGIGNKISSLFYIPLNAIGGALTPYVGQNIGAGNIKRMKECFNKSMELALIISIILTIIGFLGTKYAILIFVNNASPALLAQATEYAYFSIGTAIFMGWFNNLCAVYNGSGNTKYTLILSTFRLWDLRIPMIYLFGLYTNLGPTGIWCSMVLSNVITCIVGQIIYQKRSWVSNTLNLNEG